MVMEIAAKLFLSISTAEAIDNGMGIMTIIALAGATYGWGAVAYPFRRGAVAKWGFRHAVNW